MRRLFKSILKDVKLPEDLTLYDIRHTCATLLLAEGENPKIVSEQLKPATIVLAQNTCSLVFCNTAKRDRQTRKYLIQKKPKK